MLANTTEGAKSHVPPLSDLKINGTTPFHSHADGVDERLAEARALLTLLAGAHNVCEESPDGLDDAFKNLRHEIFGRALDGIGTLIALAQYHNDCVPAERRA